MRPNHILQIDKEMVYEHPLASATITHKLLTFQRRVRILLVEYVNPTGLVGHADNFWTIALIQGASTEIGKWSTDSDVVGQGTLGANTIVNPVLVATDANHVIEAGVLASVVLTKAAAAANLPLGRMMIHYKLVD